MPEQNRQERRRAKYGGIRTTEHGGWPTTQPNPVFDSETDTAGVTTSEPSEKPKPRSKPEPEPGQADTGTES